MLSDPVRRKEYDSSLLLVGMLKPKANRLINIKRIALIPLRDFFTGSKVRINLTNKQTGGAESYEFDMPPNSAPGDRFRIERVPPHQRSWIDVRLKARPHPRFKVRGSDLKMNLPVSQQYIQTGATITFPDLFDRALRMNLPPNYSTGDMAKFAGHGLPRAHGGRGDLLVRLVVRRNVK